MAERFRNEAYIQSSVSHPNIACIRMWWPAYPCIIMEYVEGESLEHLDRKGKLSTPRLERVIGQLASALSVPA